MIQIDIKVPSAFFSDVIGNFASFILKLKKYKSTQHKTIYKNSPLDLVPEDWEVKKNCKISIANQGLQSQIEERLTVKNSFKYITIQYFNKRN